MLYDLNELQDVSPSPSSVSGKVKERSPSALVGCLGEGASVGGDGDFEEQESRKDQNAGLERQGAAGQPSKHRGVGQQEVTEDRGVEDDRGKQGGEGQESDPESEECACRPCKKCRFVSSKGYNYLS